MKMKNTAALLAMLGCASAFAATATFENGAWDAMPSDGDDIVIRGGGTSDIVWGASMPASVASWTQESSFTNAVVFETTFPAGAFPVFEITGNADIQGGTWIHRENTNTEAYRLSVSIGGDLTVGANAEISALARGFRGGNNGLVGWGCYGGIGHAYTQSGVSWGSTYGSIYAPTNLGQGGEANSWAYAGGGAIRLDVAGDTLLYGRIAADGAGNDLPGYDGVNHYTGTGGSVWLTTGTLSGSGAISANGGNAIYHMMGSGGRVAVTLTATGADFTGFTGATTGAITAFGGQGTSYPNNYGAAGTVYLRTAAQAQDDGLLVIDNNNSAMSAATHHATLIAASQTDTTFGEIVIRRNGWLAVDPGQTIHVRRGIRNENTNAAFGIDTYYEGAIELIDAAVTATLSGNTTYGTLTCSAAGKTLLFGAGDTLQVLSSLTLAGELNNPLTLGSTTPGTAWRLRLADATSQTLDFLEVADSDASTGAAAGATHSSDMGGNTHWAFIVPGETITWTGASSALWGNGANWDLGRTPVATDVVVIPGSCPDNPTLDIAREAGTLRIASGATLSLAGHDLAIADELEVAGALIAAGTETLAVGGDADFTGGALTPAQSTIRLNGASAQTVILDGCEPFALAVANTFGGLTFSDAVTASSFLIDSASASFAADATFSSVSALANTAAASITVAPGRTLSTGSLSVAGDSNAVSLGSMVAGSTFTVAVSGAASVSGAIVTDSVASPMSLVALNSTDGGNNAGWIFSNDIARWTGAVSTDFANAGNWSSGAVPTASTHVFVDGAVNACVLSSDATVASLSVGGSGAATFRANARLTVDGGVIVGDAGTLVLNRPASVASSMAVLAGGTLSHDQNGSAEVNKLDVSIAGSFTLASGATIDAYAKGFAPGSFGSSASHAGAGGNQNVFNGAMSYGSIYCPTNIGATGEGWGRGYEGGGAIHLAIAGAATLDGRITADALAPTANNHYSGTGGSIWIEAATLSGAASISANGGDTVYHTLGSGGRIALTATAPGADLSGLTGPITAYGGFGGNTSESWGAAGTIYLRNGGQAIDEGTLVIDNAGQAISKNRGHATLICSTTRDRTFGEIVFRGCGWLVIRDGVTVKVKRGIRNENTVAGYAIDTTYDSPIEFVDSSVTATLAGDITLPSLLCTTPGKAIEVAPGSTLSIVNNFTLQGAQGNEIVLRSSTPGQAWNLNVPATVAQGVEFVDASDSDASSGSAIAAFRSIDSGNNVNWAFAAAGETITWTGAADTAWGNSANWDLARAPSETDRVVIPAGCARYPLLDLARAAATLFIEEGASLGMNGHDLSVAYELSVVGALAASGSERLVLAATNTVFAADCFDAAASSIVFAGDRPQRAAFAGNDLFAVVSSNEAAAVTLVDPFTAHSLESASGDLVLQSGFETELFAVSADTRAVALSVAPGCTGAIGALNLHGGANGVVLASTASGSGYSLAVSGSADVRNVTVSDCTASGIAIVPVSATDAGRNVNWIFGEPWSVWTGAVSSDFGNGANWSPEGVPGTGARVLVDDCAVPCEIASDAAFAELVVGGTGEARLVATAPIALSGSIVAGAGGTISLNSPSTVGGSVDILPGGVLTHESIPNAETRRIDLAIGGDLHVARGGAVTAYGKGFSQNAAPAFGALYCHGGIASHSAPGNNTVYGSIYCPTNCGAGGQSGTGSINHSGGGAIHLAAAGNAVIDGAIDADATTEMVSNTHYSGAGGSVWIEAATLTGSGSITANGGDVNYHQTGSGGRVAVTLAQAGATFDGFTGTILARGGLGNARMTYNYTPYYRTWGSAGTIYLREGGQAIDEGTLIIDNANSALTFENNSSTYFSTDIRDRAFGRVVIRSAGRIGIQDGVTLTVKDGWSNAGHLADASSGAVEFTGAAVTIQGANAWHDLAFTAPGGVVTFEAGASQTIAGDVSFADRSTLQSSVAGSPWRIAVGGASAEEPYDVGRVIVSDSDASAGRTINARPGCQDRGGNTNWIFNPIRGTFLILY